MSRPSPEQVRDLLDYDMLSGRMFWRVRVAVRSPIGSEAGFLADGRHRITIKGKRYFRSVLAWVIVNGEWPEHEVDHENRNRLDDRWANLRTATRSQNLANRGMLRSNSSGVQGVVWVSAVRRWQAQIQKDGKSIYIGRFVDKNTAAEAYRKKARELYGEYAQSCAEQSAWVRSGSSPADDSAKAFSGVIAEGPCTKVALRLAAAHGEQAGEARNLSRPLGEEAR